MDLEITDLSCVLPSLTVFIVSVKTVPSESSHSLCEVWNSAIESFTIESELVLPSVSHEDQKG